MNKFVRLLFLLLPVYVQAQRADLSFEIKGLKEKTAILANYVGGLTYVLDSTSIDSLRGQFRFQTSGLKPGIYLVSIDNKRLLDFVITKADEKFIIKGDVPRLPAFEVENSLENDVFLRFEAERFKTEQRIEKKKQMLSMIQRATKDREALEPAEKELRKEYQQIDSSVAAYITQYPTHLYAKMLKSVRPPDVPSDIPPQLNGRYNPAYIQWARLHYFDNTDFRDERFLGNKIWNLYFDNYFQRLVSPEPDSIAASIDYVLGKMPRNEAFYKWAVVHLIQIFEQNDEPGADRLFVHLVDQYQKVKETPWVDEATLLRLEYKANAFRPVLSGNIAPDFNLQDKKGAPQSLHSIQSPYVLLIFYSPLCKHCMEAMPDIYQTWLDARPFGVEALAVSTDNQFEYWKKFVVQQNYEWIDLADPAGENAYEKVYNNYNLPVIYLLDKEKKILRKRIKPDKLRDMLKNYLTKEK